MLIDPLLFFVFEDRFSYDFTAPDTFVTVGTPVSTPVVSIKSPDGDVIDCIDIYNQPAFSLACNGSFANGDVNTVEAGWQRDAYNNTGCYSTHCGGFVQTSSTIALEAAIIRTSTFGGPQFAITIQIWKDQSSGNWWLGLGLNMELVGYWPGAIFTGLADHTDTVEWGGKILSQNSAGANTIVQMGSGEFT
ncbi:unnamed protein product [Eruca vesicaria subsp. sativa]|uniref:Neprosin PEP catalytic domain-containing protein n=1 Tax=Eruca vesicaria subsp. sativa TaxID=29727 RepID=A0ABC8LHU6_ERUVS|nr:unnamed protein product [Eruca vesicaria subsp. sativa]